MQQTRIKELRVKNNYTQEQMAEALHISQNAYSLIENGKTKLLDEERINIIAKKFGVKAIDLGLFEGLGITQNFYEKVENGYNYIENLHAENKELVIIMRNELQTKNKQLEEMMLQIQSLISKLK
jgi:transcriptional regulator with XRE-family HTH domain